MLTPQRGCFKSDGSWDSDVTVNILRFNFMFALVNTALALDGGQCWFPRGKLMSTLFQPLICGIFLECLANLVEKEEERKPPCCEKKKKKSPCCGRNLCWSSPASHLWATE